jgi:ATP-dependent Clp protease ATP-binding subunit ClpB
LKRVIQRHVQDPLAEMILAGDIVGGDRVAISVEGNVLTFNGKVPQTAEIEEFQPVKAKGKLH